MKKETYPFNSLKSSPLPQYSKIGVLVLHGFTSGLEAVSGLKPFLDKKGLKSSFPLLRGHGTRFQDLKGVTYQDWIEDAEKALMKLAATVDKVVVVGLSMGGLVTLELAIKHPDKIAGIVTVAAALKFKDPLAPLSHLLSKLVPYWPSPNSFNDQTLKKKYCSNYKWFPTSTFVELYKLSKKVEKDLSQVKVPILILQSKKDQIIKPESAKIIDEKVSSPYRQICWFEKSGHEMLQDLEAQGVMKVIMEYILKFVKN